MILKIKDSMNDIKPDMQLLEKTEQAMRKAQQEMAAKSENTGKRRFLHLKTRYAAAACIIIAANIFSAAGYAYMNAPANSLYIDINPSVGLDISRRDRVVDVNYFGAGSKELVSENVLKGKKSSEAVEEVVEAAKAGGYLKDGSVVSLAVYPVKGKSKSGELLSSSKNAVTAGFANTAVYTSVVAPQLKSEADSYSMSPGKLGIIKLVQKLDENAKIEDYKDKSVTDIFDNIVSLSSDSNSKIPQAKKDEVLADIKDIEGKFVPQEDVKAQTEPSSESGNGIQAGSDPAGLPESSYDRPSAKPAAEPQNTAPSTENEQKSNITKKPSYTQQPQDNGLIQTPQTAPENTAPQAAPENTAPQAAPENTAPQAAPENTAPQAAPENTAPQAVPETKTVPRDDGTLKSPQDNLTTDTGNADKIQPGTDTGKTTELPQKPSENDNNTEDKTKTGQEPQSVGTHQNSDTQNGGAAGKSTQK